MRSIYVPLPEGAADRLRELARREMLDPREQAAWLILAGLKEGVVMPRIESPDPRMREGPGHLAGPEPHALIPGCLPLFAAGLRAISFAFRGAVYPDVVPLDRSRGVYGGGLLIGLALRGAVTRVLVMALDLVHVHLSDKRSRPI